MLQRLALNLKEANNGRQGAKRQRQNEAKEDEGCQEKRQRLLLINF